MEAAENYKSGDAIQRHVIRTATGLSDETLRDIAKQQAAMVVPPATATAPTATAPSAIPNTSPPPQPTAQSIRGEQTSALEKITDAVNDTKIQPPLGKEMAKHVNSTNVINNNSNTTIVRPEVRTPEPSFNRVLSRNVSF